MKYNKENYATFYGKVEKESSYGKPIKIVESLPTVLKSGSVLDLGAGDGRHALFLASKGFEVKALDVSEAALAKLERLAEKNHLSVKTGLVDLARWSFDQSYDAVVASVIFQHLQTQVALQLLHEMKMHTNPGGINAVTLFTKNGDRCALDKEEDPDAFYPEDNWLKTFYQDWEILEHDLSSSPLIGKFHNDGTPMENMVEKILARKPTHL